MTTKEIRELTALEIESKLRDTRDELLQLRLRKQTGQVERTHEVRDLRKSVARLQTLLKEKQTAAAPAAA